MLLHDESRRSRTESILITAQESRRSRFGNSILDIQRLWIISETAHTEHESLAIDNRHHRICGQAILHELPSSSERLVQNARYLIRIGDLGEGTGSNQEQQKNMRGLLFQQTNLETSHPRCK